jgi:hypothetical protein
MIRSLFLLALLLGATAFAPARAEINDCINITSLPAVITTQGVYCLKQNLETAISSGAAITIATNNITIDCNDWKIGGLAAGPSTAAVGIFGDDRLNVTIRHCGVRGFIYGIGLFGITGAGHLVEDNRAELSTVVGIVVDGYGSVIRRNRVLDIGGQPGAAEAWGIVVGGIGAVVSDNLINGVSVAGREGNGSVTGIAVYGSSHEFSRNLVVNLLPIGTGVSVGLWGDGPSSYRANTLMNFVAKPGTGLIAGALSFCKDNFIRNYATAISSCTDAGGNFSN